MSDHIPRAAFSIGQLVRHKLFGYRGVIADVDPSFQLTDEWYEQVAQSRPPKDRPWYQVLVDGGESTTYVAERNLTADATGQPVTHPLLTRFFTGFHDGSYTSEGPVH